MTLDGTLCLFNGQQIIVPTAEPEGIITHFTFDQGQVYDQSGKKNHSLNNIPRGPGYSNEGNSAYFKGKQYLEIENNEDFNFQTYTIQFWIYLIDSYDREVGKSRKLCPLFQKGQDNLQKNEFQRSPGIYLNTVDRTLKVYVSTNDQDNFPQGEEINSTAKIMYNKWNQITFTKDGDKLKLYINGILDAVSFLSTFPVPNEQNFYVGNTPNMIDECSVQFYMDEFRIYDIALKNYEIQAEAGSALGGIEPSSLHFGCLNCELEKAKNSCIQKYHLCTSLEIYSGIYQVARIMGWVEWNSNIWSYNSVIEESQKQQEGGQDNNDQVKLGLGICCKDLDY